MTDETNSGASAPVPEPSTRILDASALDARPAPQPAVPAPAPLEGDALLIDNIEKKMAALEEQRDTAETGRERREITAQIEALTNEKARLQLRDVIEPTERESAPPAPEDTIAPYELVPKQYQALADAYTADAQEIAKDAGIPAQEMEVMLHLAIGGALDAVGQDSGLSVGQVPGVDLSNRNACMNHLTRKYGDQAPIIVKEAQAAFAKLPKKVQAYLDRDSGTGELLTNSPHVLLALAARNLGWTGLSKESAKKELAKLQGKPLSAFDLDKRRILNHIVGRGKSKGADWTKFDKGVVQKTPSEHSRAKLEAEARSLRLDVGYTDKSRPNHKQILARVQAIHAELSPETGR